MSNAKVIEYNEDFASEIIIDHPRHGRIYAVQGRESEHEPYCNWADGLAVKVLPNDTLDSLHAIANAEYQTTVIECAIYGADDGSRTLLEWDGHAVENMVCAALESIV